MSFEEGDSVFFDVGYGIEQGFVTGVQDDRVLLDVPMDGPRMLPSDGVYEAREAAEAADETEFL